MQNDHDLIVGKETTAKGKRAILPLFVQNLAYECRRSEIEVKSLATKTECGLYVSFTG